MIRPGEVNDFREIHAIINDAAIAYKGIIPEDRWKDPYMPEAELQSQIDDGVRFYCYSEGDVIMGVMGIQEKTDVTLIRHAYVRTTARNNGIGGKLLNYLSELSDQPVLIGTWADATWAINFYLKHGFNVVPFQQKEILLRKYWNIPERQVETSVVLADANWWRYSGTVR